MARSLSGTPFSQKASTLSERIASSAGVCRTGRMPTEGDPLVAVARLTQRATAAEVAQEPSWKDREAGSWVGA